MFYGTNIISKIDGNECFMVLKSFVNEKNNYTLICKISNGQ